jgi:peptidoglycan/LPS O-acetylase OafA/YrhL
MATDIKAHAAASPPATASHRRKDIQGLRAVAVLMVVAFHAGLPLPGGFVGVDVFFVISGFVITAMLMREWVTTGGIRFRHFYFRRFLRLTPALALTVTLVALASILLQNPFGAQQMTAQTGLGAMLLSANFAIAHAAGDYFADSSTTNPLLNTWSLSVEEQFYLVFPALFMLGWTMSRRMGRRLLPPVLIVAAIGLSSFAVSLALSFGSGLAHRVTDYFGGPESFAFYSPFTRAWEFAVGALLALLLDRLPAASTMLTRLVGLVGAGLIAASALLIHDAMPFPGTVAIVPVLGTALVLAAGARMTTGINSALAARPMVAIGDASYSWYLWHWPIIVFTALLLPNRPTALILAALASLVPALLSYRLVEQPIRRLRPRTRPRAAAVIVGTLAIPMTACAVLLVGASTGWGLVPPSTAGAAQVTTGAAGNGAAAGAAVDTPAAAAVQDGETAGGNGGSLRSQHAAVRAGCVNTPLNATRCRFGPANPVGTVLLAGDSQAYALADGVIDAAAGLGYDTIATSHTGCPFLGRESNGVHNYPCRSWQKSIVDYALKTRPAVVLIANRSAGYVHPEWKWRTAATDSGGMAGSISEAAALWRKGLDPVVAALTKAGIPVVIIGAVPEMHGYTDTTSLLSKAFGSTDFDLPRQQLEADRKPALDVERSIAAAYPGAYVFDPFPALCDAKTCAATRDGDVRYQDETHLSVAGSLRLSDGLGKAISQAVAGSAPQPR